MALRNSRLTCRPNSRYPFKKYKLRIGIALYERIVEHLDQ
jgi:hypothetical protein